MARKAMEGRFEVSANEKLLPTPGAAINNAQRYAESVLNRPGTVYVRELGNTRALARVERDEHGVIVTYLNGAV